MFPTLLLSVALAPAQPGFSETAPPPPTPLAASATVPRPLGVAPPDIDEIVARIAAEAPPDAAPKPIEINALLLPETKPAAPPADTPAAPAPTPPDRWLLMKALQGTWPGSLLDDHRMAIYGWTEASVTYGSQGRTAWPMLAQSPTNDFLLNQNWLVFERTVVTTGTTQPTFGFHTAWILPGSDARYTVSRHLLNRQRGVGDFTQGNYPIDLFHAYGEAYFPTVARGLDVKVGKNAVPYFAETEDKINNPLFSHSYMFYFCGPFTHTGLQANLKLSDEWAVEARLVLGSDIAFGPGESPTFVGTVTWTQPGGGRNTVLLSTVLGSGRFDTEHNQANQNMVDLIYTHTFSPVLKYTLDAGAGYIAHVPDTGTVSWYGAAQYLSYTISPRLSANGRFELFDDPQGGRTGFKGLYTAVTGGVTFKPRKSVWVRPELRYDYNSDSRPFGDSHGQFSVATDVILRW